MGAYDDPLGSILVASWISCMLFMLIIIETIRYYTSFKSDALSTKIFVAVAVVVDAVSLAGDCADIYLYTISHWGDTEFLVKQYWPVGVYLVTTAVTALLVQSFLVNRYYALSKNWLVAGFLSLCILVSFGGAIATTIIITRFSGYAQRFMLRTPATIWLTMTAVTDVLIALVLIWQLYTMKTSFKTTENLIKRLMRAAMQTGSTTSVIAVCILVTYFVNNASNVPTAFCFVLSRTYILTLLYNLNIRKTSKKEGSSATVSDHDNSRSRGRGAAMAMEGIHVQRTAVVHIDTSVDDHALTPSSFKSQNDDKAVIV